MVNHLFRRAMTAALFSLLAIASALAAEAPPTTSWDVPVRLPRTGPPTPGETSFSPGGGAPAQLAGGVWREDGQTIILYRNGREVRLPKSVLAQARGGMPGEAERAGGAVHGRLFHQGRPLENCSVALSSLSKRFTGYTVDRSAKPLRALTDARGVYYFENVPAGAYKLSWLPDGTNRWIRRIKMQPDVSVRGGEVVGLTDIRIALRAVN